MVGLTHVRGMYSSILEPADRVFVVLVGTINKSESKAINKCEGEEFFFLAESNLQAAE